MRSLTARLKVGYCSMHEKVLQINFVYYFIHARIFFCNTSSASETNKRPRGTQKNEDYPVRYGGNISNQTHNIVLVKRFQIEAFRVFKLKHSEFVRLLLYWKNARQLSRVFSILKKYKSIL